MASIRPIHYQQLVRVFELEGFLYDRQVGDHLIYTKEGLKRPLVIPMYLALHIGDGAWTIF